MDCEDYDLFLEILIEIQKGEDFKSEEQKAKNKT